MCVWLHSSQFYPIIYHNTPVSFHITHYLTFTPHKYFSFVQWVLYVILKFNLFDPKKKLSSPRKSKPPAYEDILEDSAPGGSGHKSKPPAYEDLVEESDLPRPPVGFGGSRVDLAESDGEGESDWENDDEVVYSNLLSL